MSAASASASNSSVVRLLLAPSLIALGTQLAEAQAVQWNGMPRMQLERQFAGPLKDTVIQRWRDPADGTVCYIYLPINAPHTPPVQSGYVQYGPNTIGSISCMLQAAVARPAPPPRTPPAPPKVLPPPKALAPPD
jgi:hypothetical protein